MMQKELYILRQRNSQDTWGRHWSETKGVVRLYDDEDNLLAYRSFSTKHYFRQAVERIFPKRFKNIWDRCYYVVSPNIIDE